MFDLSVGDPLRSVLKNLTAIIYVMASEETRPQYWSWLLADSLSCGQSLVALFGAHAVTPTIKHSLHHGAEKLLQVREAEEWLGLMGILSMRTFGEWAAEEAHRLRAPEASLLVDNENRQ